MIKLRKKEEIILQTEAADKILQAVFEKTETQPNTTPLYVLTAYSTYRKDRFALQRTILIIIMTLFLLLPLLFLSPTLSITSEETEEYTSAPLYTIKVDHFMPVTRITAMVDGRNIPVYEVDMHTYTVQPTTNGKMVVNVALVNFQEDTKTVQIDNVDMEPPVLISNDTDKDNVYLVFSDTGSGIDFESIHALDASGVTLFPVSVNEETNQVAFTYPKDTINVFVEDRAGNSLQLVISLR